MAQEWYIDYGDRVDGPVSSQELTRRASDGRLRPGDRVSQDRRKWAEASRVKGLTFLSRSPPGVKDTSVMEEPAATPTTPGYELLSYLGAGACGVVYKARQVKLDRIVALKMVKLTERTKPSMIARFEKEAVALAKLQHPNIVNIFDAGRTSEQFFFAMELLAGEDLAHRIHGRGPLDERTSWAIARQAASALAHAASVGIYHRDIKPANLFLVKMPTGYGLPPDLPLVKVMDFGLALTQRTEQDQTGPDRLTQAGTVVGTPAYMAPEQFKTPDIDHRADIYSLGATVLHALDGQPPFDGPTVWDVMLRKAEGKPPIPTKPVAPETAELLAAMLAPTLTDRVATYEDLIDRIDQLPAMRGIVSTSAPSHAALPIPTPPPEKRRTRKPIFLGLAGVGVLAAAGVGGWFALGDGGKPEPGKPQVRYVRGDHAEYLFNGQSQLSWVPLGGEVQIVQDEEDVPVLEIEKGVKRSFPPIPDYELTLGLDLHKAKSAELSLNPSSGTDRDSRITVRISRTQGIEFGTSANGKFTGLGTPLPFPSTAELDGKRSYRELRIAHTGDVWHAWFDGKPIGESDAKLPQAAELRIITDGGSVRIESPLLQALRAEPTGP